MKIRDEVKFAYQRVKYGCDESASWDIEYAMLKYLKGALHWYLDKAPEWIEDEIVKYKGKEWSKYVLACELHNKIYDYLDEKYYYEDEKKHRTLLKEIEEMYKALKSYLNW